VRSDTGEPDAGCQQLSAYGRAIPEKKRAVVEAAGFPSVAQREKRCRGVDVDSQEHASCSAVAETVASLVVADSRY